jgi:5-methylcytosine-specific restriction protein A
VIEKYRFPFECRLCLEITDDPSEVAPNKICAICAHKERGRIDSNNKKKRIARARFGEKIKLSEWMECLNKHNFACKTCKKRGRKNITLDHIVPIRDGGANAKHNIQPLCKACHASKDGNEKKSFYQKVLYTFKRYKRKLIYRCRRTFCSMKI